MSEESISIIIKALSVNSRLQIVKLIRDRKYCVNAIARKLEITQSAVSQHLKILKECNLVYAERYGSIIHYRLNQVTVDEFMKSLDAMLKKKGNDR
jgi:ArsR family transcriptional regulator, arsenate/arsenite/antimonite-responsive transcriptional repressor